jgi:hypothetical protein
MSSDLLKMDVRFLLGMVLVASLLLAMSDFAAALVQEKVRLLWSLAESCGLSV